MKDSWRIAFEQSRNDCSYRLSCCLAEPCATPNGDVLPGAGVLGFGS